MSKQTILLIESSDSVRKIIIMACKKKQELVGNLFILQSPADLPAMIERQNIDIIFSNIEFTGFQDFYVPQFLKEKKDKTPVYLITSSPLNEMITQVAFHSGAKGIIQPLKSLALLFDVIEKILNHQVDQSFFVPEQKNQLDKVQDSQILSEHLEKNYQDVSRQVMELNEMVISLMIELNLEKEKVSFWENQIKSYINLFNKTPYKG